MKNLSIGTRLTLYYVLIFAAAQALFGAGMYFVVRHGLYEIANSALTSQVEDVRKFLASQKKKNMSVPKLQEEFSETYLIQHTGDYLQISTAAGESIYRAQFLQQYPLAAPNLNDRPVFEDRVMGGKPFRFICQSITVNAWTYSLQTGVPTGDILRMMTILRRSLVSLAPLVLLVAAALGRALSRRALAPVDALTQTARSIGGENLSQRLPELRTGDEVQRLSDTLNGMLSRIEGAFQRITQFTADASHELRTPVALMRTEAELALRRSRSESEYREALRHILLESERTTFLLEQLLSLARADSGSETLSLAPIEIATMVNEVAAGWRQIAAIRNLEFRADVTDGEMTVVADESAVRRVLNILLDNAFKYTTAPGYVVLSLKRSDEKASIEISDSGPGIEESDREKIFERFYRVDKARSRELGGAGLGLSIAQWIVAQHKGRIWLKSTPGSGTNFYVEIPLATAPAQLSLTA